MIFSAFCISNRLQAVKHCSQHIFWRDMVCFR